MEVFYPSVPASDGVTSPAVNSVFQVFELADTSYSNPLPLLSVGRIPSREVRTSEQGVLPPTYVTSDNLSHNFKSGEWVWRRDSFDGAERSVEASQQAAAQAAASAASSAEAVAERSVPSGGTMGQTLVKLSDANGHTGWQDQSGGGGSGVGAVMYATGSSTVARPTSSSQVMVIFLTTGTTPPVNMAPGLDLWVQRS